MFQQDIVTTFEKALPSLQAHGSQFFPGSFLLDWVEYIYVHKYVYIHTYVYICTCILMTLLLDAEYQSSSYFKLHNQELSGAKSE